MFTKNKGCNYVGGDFCGDRFIHRCHDGTSMPESENATSLVISCTSNILATGHR